MTSCPSNRERIFAASTGQDTPWGMVAGGEEPMHWWPYWPTVKIRGPTSMRKFVPNAEPAFRFVIARGREISGNCDEQQATGTRTHPVGKDGRPNLEPPILPEDPDIENAIPAPTFRTRHGSGA